MSYAPLPGVTVHDVLAIANDWEQQRRDRGEYPAPYSMRLHAYVGTKLVPLDLYVVFDKVGRAFALLNGRAQILREASFDRIARLMHDAGQHPFTQEDMFVFCVELWQETIETFERIYGRAR